MRIDRFVRHGAAILLLIPLVGCGTNYGTVPVSGTVTYRGQPVVGEILFVPDLGPGEAARRGATAPLDASGRYRLTTFNPGDGALPGKYKVAVVSRGDDKPVPAKKKGKMMDEDMQGSGDPLIPPRYFDPQTSGLAAEVTARGSQTFDFDLKD